MISCVVGLILIVLSLGISWGITVGLVYLACLCFAWEFSWLIATGVWIVICIIRSIFK